MSDILCINKLNYLDFVSTPRKTDIVPVIFHRDFLIKDEVIYLFPTLSFLIYLSIQGDRYIDKFYSENIFISSKNIYSTQKIMLLIIFVKCIFCNKFYIDFLYEKEK